jgi:peptidoglycan/LPS O-acetylase OafA/YrhL
MVVSGHLILLFWPYLVAPEIHPEHTSPYQTYLAFSPLSLFWDGRLAVPIFFALSGYVLTASVVGSRRPLVFPALVLKRYLRLALPVLATSLLVLILIPAGLYYSLEVAMVSGSTWLAGTLPPDFTPTVASWLGQSLWTTFFDFHDSYFNPALWTMHYELEGSLLCYALCILLGNARWRIAAEIVLLILCGLWLRTVPLHLFMAGALLYELPRELPRISPRRLPAATGNILGLALILLGLLLPRVLTLIPGLVSWPFLIRYWLADLLPFWRGDRFSTEAVLAVAGLCLAPALQSLLSRPVFRFLGAISFPLYLTHLPVLFSAACFIFLVLAGRLGQIPAALVTIALGLPLTILVATLALHLVERPSLLLSRGAGAWADRLWRSHFGPKAASV